MGETFNNNTKCEIISQERAQLIRGQAPATSTAIERFIEFYKQCDRGNETESIEEEIQRLKSERDDLFGRIGMLEEMAANR